MYKRQLEHRAPQRPIDRLLGQRVDLAAELAGDLSEAPLQLADLVIEIAQRTPCLLYTSDAADERSSVDLGGRRIIKKKKQQKARVQGEAQGDKPGLQQTNPKVIRSANKCYH